MTAQTTSKKMDTETPENATKPLYYILISPLGGYRVIRAKTCVSTDWSVLEGAASYKEASGRMRELIEARDRELALGRELVLRVLHRTYAGMRVTASAIRAKGFSGALDVHKSLSATDQKYLSWVDSNPALFNLIEHRAAA